ALSFLEAWRQETGFHGEIVAVGASREEATLRTPSAAPWRWLGRRPAAEVHRLMQQSRVVVYASDYEGFGMPPVEATLAGPLPCVFADRRLAGGHGRGRLQLLQRRLRLLRDRHGASLRGALGGGPRLGVDAGRAPPLVGRGRPRGGSPHARGVVGSSRARCMARSVCN